MAKGDDIQERLMQMAVDTVLLCDQLPKRSSASHIAEQLMRSATSPAPNYAEARGAESDRDFVHKLGVVLKELNETGVWMQILIRTGMIPAQQVKPIQDECTSLCRILAASIRTMKQREK